MDRHSERCTYSWFHTDRSLRSSRHRTVSTDIATGRLGTCTSRGSEPCRARSRESRPTDTTSTTEDCMLQRLVPSVLPDKRLACTSTSRSCTFRRLRRSDRAVPSSHPGSRPRHRGSRCLRRQARRRRHEHRRPRESSASTRVQQHVSSFFVASAKSGPHETAQNAAALAD